MLALALVPLVGSALAQSAPPSRYQDDPEYLRYVELLGELDDLADAPRDVPQIDMGMVNIISLGSQPQLLGEVWAHKVPEVLPGEVSRDEHWFVGSTSLLEPSTGFRLVMVDDAVDHRTAAENFLDANHPGVWTADPYLPMRVNYTVGPSLEQQNNLVYQGPQVDRFGFVLTQGGAQVGAMLRERHYDGNGALDHVLEHWLYFDDGLGTFEMLRDNGDQLVVAPDPAHNYATTAGFFFTWQGRGWLAYAKPVYDLTLVGSDF